ncbi:hypothetical protein GGF31_001947 [Allomyces arbusculus]|nr:hypothetical protein GGF31_001947 [Allomyces arbusculus]
MLSLAPAPSARAPPRAPRRTPVRTLPRATLTLAALLLVVLVASTARAADETVQAPAMKAVGVSYATLAKIGTTVYVMGGMDDQYKFSGAKTDTFALDLNKAQKANALSTKGNIAPLPVGFGNGCAVVAGDGSTITVVAPQLPNGDGQSKPPMFQYSVTGNSWSAAKEPSDQAVANGHATSEMGEAGLVQFSAFGADPNSKSGVTATSKFMVATVKGLGQAQSTAISPLLYPSVIMYNSTHMIYSGGRNVDAGTFSTARAFVSIQNGDLARIPELNVGRELFATFIYKKGKYVIHLGGNMQPKDIARGMLIEYVTPANGQWPSETKVANADKGPSVIRAPTAFLYDDHIFILGGVTGGEPNDGVPTAAGKYLRILQIKEESSGSLTFTWVDSYTPSADAAGKDVAAGPCTENAVVCWAKRQSVLAWVGYGVAFMFVGSMILAGLSWFKGRQRAKAEEYKLQKRAEQQLGARGPAPQPGTVPAPSPAHLAASPYQDPSYKVAGGMTNNKGYRR